MRQTLFFIPHEIAGVPVFGIGWLLLAWIAASLVMLFWMTRKHGWNEETRGFLPFVALVGLVIAFLLPNVEMVVNGVKLGLPIRGYGVMLLLATVAGVALAVHRAKQVGLPPDTIFNLAFQLFIGGIIGARLFFVIQYWDGMYDPNSIGRTLLNIVNFVEGGLVVYGSLIGAVVTATIFLVRHKLPPLAVADLIAPSLVVGLSIGRIGCLMNGCCYGGVCEQPWAVQFPSGSPAYYDQLRQGQFHGIQIGENATGKPVIRQVLPGTPAAETGIEAGMVVAAINGYATDRLPLAQAILDDKPHTIAVSTENGSQFSWEVDQFPERTLPVHPTQIYSAINAALLACVTYFAFPFRRRDGETFALLLGCYAVTRFLLEAIRTDEGNFAFGLTISQNVSIGMLVLVAALIAYLATQPKGSYWPRPAV